MNPLYDLLKIDRKGGNHVTHLVKTLSKENPKNVPNELLLQDKYDGVHGLFVLSGDTVRIFSRTGLEFTNTEYLKKHFLARADHFNYANGVYFAEIIVYGWELQQLSGFINPKRKEPLSEAGEKAVNQLQYRTFGYVRKEEFISGIGEHEYIHIHGYLLALDPDVYAKSQYIDKAQAQPLSDTVILAGGEGTVVKDPMHHWTAGKRGHGMWKIVGNIDKDLKLVGYEIGTNPEQKTYNKITNLILHDAEGVEHIVTPSGYDTAALQQMRLDMDDLVGGIYRCKALTLTSGGKLRNGKMHERRIDKTEPDSMKA